MFGRLDALRRDIFANNTVISRLTAKGIEPREYIACRCDEEYAMDRALYNLSVLKRRYCDEIKRFGARPGPKLPDAVATVWREAA